jgi:hypothetical protein
MKEVMVQTIRSLKQDIDALEHDAKMQLDHLTLIPSTLENIKWLSQAITTFNTCLVNLELARKLLARYPFEDTQEVSMEAHYFHLYKAAFVLFEDGKYQIRDYANA